MKNISFILFLFTNYLFSQNNFQVENNNLIWQQVFEIDSTNQIEPYFKNIAFTASLTANNTTISGNSNTYQIKNKTGLPIYAYSDFKAFVVIEIKESKYRVTVSNIFFKGLEIDFGGVKNNSEEHIEMYVLKKDNTIRPSQTTQNTLKSINDFFIEIFTIKPNISNW